MKWLTLAMHVQENYINHRPSLARSDQQRLQILAKAADAFSVGDLVNRRVRQYGNWFPHAPSRAWQAACCLQPTCAACGRLSAPNEMNFPRYAVDCCHLRKSNLALQGSNVPIDLYIMTRFVLSQKPALMCGCRGMTIYRQLGRSPQRDIAMLKP